MLSFNSLNPCKKYCYSFLLSPSDVGGGGTSGVPLLGFISVLELGFISLPVFGLGTRDPELVVSRFLLLIDYLLENKRTTKISKLEKRRQRRTGKKKTA